MQLGKYEFVSGNSVDKVEQHLARLDDIEVDISPHSIYTRKIYHLNDEEGRIFEAVSGNFELSMPISYKENDGSIAVRVADEIKSDGNEIFSLIHSFSYRLRVGVYYHERDLEHGLRGHIDKGIEKMIDKHMNDNIRLFKDEARKVGRSFISKLDNRMEVYDIPKYRF